MELLVALVTLAGSVALLLWGIHMVQTGMQRAFGAGLRRFLGSALRNRVKAFLAGLGVTALLQSSTATGLMLTGFVTGGLVDLVPALAVMLGANVGTTLIVQVLSFDVAAFAPVLFLVGVLLFRRATAAARDFGRLLIGLGLVLLSLHQFLSLLQPLESMQGMRAVFGEIATQPLLAVIVAAAITWAAHSSVAVVLLVMSLAAKGVVPMQAAFALVLGANLGTAINPVLEGTTDQDPASRRLPLGNLLNRFFGVSVALLLLPYLRPMGPDPSRAVANFHTIFNLAVALISLPLLTPYASLLQRFLPARVDAADPGVPMYLDASLKKMPGVALGGAAREALRLADVLKEMLLGLRDALEKGDRRLIGETRRKDDVVDRLNAAIKGYLTSIDYSSLEEADHHRVRDILAFATNLEHAGDIVDKNLLNLATKKLKRGLSFSPEGQAELLAMLARLIVNVGAAAALFMTGDERAARLLAQEKEAFRAMEETATETHYERLRAGRIESAETSTLHLDALRDLKRVNAHLVAGAAYPVLERKGELLPSRIRAR